MRDHAPTPLATLRRARAIALSNGLRYVYTGNVRDEDGGSTRCHACGTVLIGRNGYELTRWQLTASGHCARCGAPCAGIFDAEAGHWGSRRMPIRMS
jgi:pyruvate formate lyase activating enzyme